LHSQQITTEPNRKAMTDNMGVTVTEITQPSGKTYWFTTYNGQPQVGYSTPEIAEKVAESIRQLRREQQTKIKIA
jgi:hypothetical protein